MFVPKLDFIFIISGAVRNYTVPQLFEQRLRAKFYDTNYVEKISKLYHIRGNQFRDREAGREHGCSEYRF